MEILFNDSEHKYYVKGTKKTFESVSRVLGHIKPKFADSPEQYLKKATEYFDKYKDNPKKPAKWDSSWKSGEDVANGWELKNKIITARGTKYHAIREREDIANGAFTHKLSSNGDKQGFTVEEIKNLKPGIYTELIIPNFNNWVIGQIDKVEIFDDKTFMISDYKTNDDLQVVPVKYYRPELGYKEYEYFYPPVSHMINTKFNFYQLQLSMYSLFLESLGYTFKGGRIDHVIFNDNDEVIRIDEYPITYYKDEVKSILTSFKLNKA